MLGNRARAIVIGVVTFVWAANFLAGIVVQDYQPSESINAIFMGIVGTLFAIGSRNGGNKSDNSPQATENSKPKHTAGPDGE